MSFTLKIFSFILLLILGCSSEHESIYIESPNKNISVKILKQNSDFIYNVNFKGKTIIQDSKVGLMFKNNFEFPTNHNVKKVEKEFHKDTRELPWGEKKVVKDIYNEIIISFIDTNNLEAGKMLFRAYDDGIAFRYQMNDNNKNQDSLIIINELTEFNLSEDAKAWWTPAYKENRYEYLYQKSNVSALDTCHTPLTIKYSDGTHLSIHEASLKNYSSMQLYSDSQKLICDLAPWSNGDKVRLRLPFQSPWRTIIISDDANGLIMSDLMLNCNEPSLVDDPSWIKPSKYIGIWWGMIIGKWTWEEGSRHGATNERGIKYIDFASKHGISEVLIEGWAAGWESLFPKDSVVVSFTKSTPDFDMRKVQEYAKSKGVSIQAYHETMASTKNYLAQIDSAFSLLNELGIKNVKIGHVGSKLDKSEFHYGQYGVQYFRDVLQKAFEYKLGINFHEPIKDTGERRTYPNMLTREGSRGMEFNAWSNGNPPNHTLILPFTRMLGSPMDYTPGIFDILYENLDLSNGVEFPLNITVIDSGNNFQNLRYKGSESIWFDKKMERKLNVDDGKMIAHWTIEEYFQPGEWQWGITADHPESSKNNIWLLEAIGKNENLSINVDEKGNVSGFDTLFIPFLDINNNESSITGYAATSLPRVSTTLAKQLALYVIIHSPLQMASDFIENYEKHPEAFEFIKSVPVSWDTTIVLDGEIEQFLTIARKDRNSDNWYIGGITNEESRTLQFDLSFLNEGSYVARIYADGDSADWESNPLDYQIFEKVVSKGESVTMKLANGGGQAIELEKVKD